MAAVFRGGLKSFIDIALVLLTLQHLRCTHKSEQNQNMQNPLLGGVPEGRGGLVSSAMTNPPLPLPRGD
jgi:hypothetical protein